mmetsp:Transcript_23074/g.57029  ORF Transcript_23074/g.57029 Transcript_23074/m.57029 type:complete len:430 (-) Transcript_23074:66-1355(-)
MPHQQQKTTHHALFCILPTSTVHTWPEKDRSARHEETRLRKRKIGRQPAGQEGAGISRCDAMPPFPSCLSIPPPSIHPSGKRRLGYRKRAAHTHGLVIVSHRFISSSRQSLLEARKTLGGDTIDTHSRHSTRHVERPKKAYGHEKEESQAELAVNQAGATLSPTAHTHTRTGTGTGTLKAPSSFKPSMDLHFAGLALLGGGLGKGDSQHAVLKGGLWVLRVRVAGQGQLALERADGPFAQVVGGLLLGGLFADLLGGLLALDLSGLGHIARPPALAADGEHLAALLVCDGYLHVTFFDARAVDGDDVLLVCLLDVNAPHHRLGRHQPGDSGITEHAGEELAADVLVEPLDQLTHLVAKHRQRVVDIPGMVEGTQIPAEVPCLAALCQPVEARRDAGQHSGVVQRSEERLAGNLHRQRHVDRSSDAAQDG